VDFAPFFLAAHWHSQ